MSVKLFVERSKKSIDTIRLGWDRAARLDGIFGKRRFPIFEVWDADYDVSKNGFTRAARNLSAGRKPDVYSDYLIHLSFNQTSFFLRGNYTACTRMMDRVRVAATGLENTAEKFVQERKGRGGGLR